MNIGIEMECTEDMVVRDSQWMTSIMSSCNILSVNKLFLQFHQQPLTVALSDHGHAMHAHFGHVLRPSHGTGGWQIEAD